MATSIDKDTKLRVLTIEKNNSENYVCCDRQLENKIHLFYIKGKIASKKQNETNKKDFHNGHKYIPFLIFT